MRRDWWTWGLTAGLLVIGLLVGTLETRAQDTEPSLGQKYKTALSLYDQGDYVGAQKLLLEVKEIVRRDNLQLNPATKQEIERRLALIEEKLQAKPTPAPATEVPAVETPKVVDMAKMEKLNAAAGKYDRAQALMRGRNYQEALVLFREVQTDLVGLPVADSDRTALTSNIAACEEALAAAEAAPTPAVVVTPTPSVVVEPAPMPRPIPRPTVVAEAPTPTPTPTTEPAADTRFEELARDPEVLAERAREEAALKEGGVWRGGAETGVFSDAVTADRIRIQIEEQEIRAKLSDGLVYLRERDFQRAEQKFLAAQLQVKYGDFPTPFKKQWLERIQKFLDLTAQTRAQHSKRTDQMRNQEAAQRLEDELSRMKEQQQRIKERLAEQWRTFYDRQQYDDALLVLERMRELDPEDPTIPEKINQTTHKKLAAWRHEAQMTRQQQTQYQWASNIEQMTPWFPISVYPKNWNELSDRRLRAIERQQITEKPQDRKVRQQLEESVVSFTFNEQPVMEALDFLQTLGNVNIVPDRTKFEDPDRTITLKLTNVPLETAIKLLTEQMGLKYVIRDGIVFISDEEGIKRPPETNTYDVRDLLADIPNFTGPTFELQNISGGNRGGAGGGSGTQSIFGDEEDTDQGDEFKTQEESLNDLIDLIKQVIESGTWDEGSGNAIRGRAGTVVVTHTPETQIKVQRLLDDLRKTRALQVSIDIRFITVSDDFLESIGVDFTGAGNPAATAPHYIDTDGDGIPDTSMGLEWDRTISGDNWSLLGSITNAVGLGTTLGSGRGLGGAGGLTLGGSFLDDVEVNFILTAVQQSHRATLMNAPKLTMMNGQRAYIAISRQQNFVQDITVEVSEGAVGYDPDIGTVQDGIVFDVRPTISADRRYVQMDLRPSVAVVEDIVDFQTITTGIFGGAVVQLPEISVTVVRTTVNIPDGGTLLIGGLSYAFDNEMESGVPVLSKIPLLGKLFSRRGFTTEKENLVILVKPTIIIQEEQEGGIK